MDVLHGKTALITGASSGIGEAFAHLLARAQCNLIIIARRRTLLDALKIKLEGAYSISVTVIEKDLTQPHAAEEIHAHTRSLHLPVDLLINNAGIGKQGHYLEATLQEHMQTVQLNMHALAALTYVYTQDMAAQGGGYVLFVSSMVAFSPVPTYATYAATKAFVLNFGEALAYDLKPNNITVSVAVPGGTQTPFRSVMGQAPSLRKQKTFLSAEAVAALSLDGLLKQKRVIITGKLNILFMQICKLLPKAWHIAIVNKAVE